MDLPDWVSLYFMMIHSPSLGGVRVKPVSSLATSNFTGAWRVPAVTVSVYASAFTGFISLSRMAMWSLPSLSVTSPCMVSLVLNSRMRPLLAEFDVPVAEGETGGEGDDDGGQFGFHICVVRSQSSHSRLNGGL